jgi:hypothetical protein
MEAVHVIKDYISSILPKTFYAIIGYRNIMIFKSKSRNMAIFKSKRGIQTRGLLSCDKNNQWYWQSQVGWASNRARMPLCAFNDPDFLDEVRRAVGEIVVGNPHPGDYEWVLNNKGEAK